MAQTHRQDLNLYLLHPENRPKINILSVFLSRAAHFFTTAGQGGQEIRKNLPAKRSEIGFYDFSLSITEVLGISGSPAFSQADDFDINCPKESPIGIGSSTSE